MRKATPSDLETFIAFERGKIFSTPHKNVFKFLQSGDAHSQNVCLHNCTRMNLSWIRNCARARSMKFITLKNHSLEMLHNFWFVDKNWKTFLMTHKKRIKFLPRRADDHPSSAGENKCLFDETKSSENETGNVKNYSQESALMEWKLFACQINFLLNFPLKTRWRSKLEI